MKVLICVAEGPEEQIVRELFPELKLEKFGRSHHFTSDEITLIKTGRGKIQSAIALTEILTLSREVFKNNFKGILNYGAACSFDPEIKIGDVRTSLKVVDEATRATFYPEDLIKQKSSTLVCVDNPILRANILKDTIADMESSAISTVVELHHSISRLIFLKVITDHGNDADQAINNFHKYSRNSLDLLKESVQKLLKLDDWNNLYLTYLEDKKIDQILIKNKFTKSQRERIKIVLIPKLRQQPENLSKIEQFIAGLSINEVLERVEVIF